MSARALSTGLRLLLGLLGAVAAAGGLAVALTEFRQAYLGAPLGPALAAGLACALIALAGATLVRGAWRGRIVVRRTRASRASRASRAPQ